MRRSKGQTMTLRLDGYIYEYLKNIEGDNDAEKLRYLIRYGILHDRSTRQQVDARRQLHET